MIKNSLRAVCEFHGVDGEMPPVRVIIADGERNEDVVIKVRRSGWHTDMSRAALAW